MMSYHTKKACCKSAGLSYTYNYGEATYRVKL